ncbi:hypothetical protein [Bacteroides acidifaciens]
MTTEDGTGIVHIRTDIWCGRRECGTCCGIPSFFMINRKVNSPDGRLDW